MTQSLNTIPTAAEDSALAPKKDTTTKLKGLVAGAALAAFVLGACAATALRPTATRATTNFKSAAQVVSDVEQAYVDGEDQLKDVPHMGPPGFEVYGYNGCGYSIDSPLYNLKKQDIDTTFYLADDGSKDTDAVTKSIGKGQCEYFGHTNNAQPEFKSVGKHGVIKLGPLAYKHWPEYLSCDDLSDPDHVIHSMNKHCDEHDLPKNACVINVCGTLDK